MNHAWWVVFLVHGLVILSACAPGPQTVLLTATPTLTPEPSPTATVVWFPPTVTHTPFPTPIITPTPDLQAGVGPVLYRDDFTSPALWDLAAALDGKPTLNSGALTLPLTTPRAFVFSTRREPVLTDFYVEVTASTTLCQGLDEFGLMLRVTPELDYYRFSISCDGQVRLDRIVRGEAAALEPWTFGSAPLGAPGSARLAARLQGEDLRLFVNDQHQFTVQDPLIPAGTIGLFARAAGETAVTVSFTDLVVYQIAE